MVDVHIGDQLGDFLAVGMLRQFAQVLRGL
jgi:hypothetical protein